MKDLNLFPAQEQNEQLVKVEGNQVVTTSLRVAQVFGKRHSDVLRAISQLECTMDFHKRNFALVVKMKELPQGGARKETYYNLTRDGFTFLAMGFTGKVASRFKETYIEAFNEMEKTLKQKLHTEYAKTILGKYTKEFNLKMTDRIKAGKERFGDEYGPYMDITGKAPFYENMSFEENLQNLFSFYNNTAIGAFYIVHEWRKYEKWVRNIKQRISQFTSDMQLRLGL